MTAITPIGLYIHVPFCRLKCSYCDFNTYAGLDALIPTYVNAICSEIDHYNHEHQQIQINTIFFGGGTPSLLPIQSYKIILSKIQSTFTLQPETEITLEANPGTLTLDYLKSLFDIGLNRISIGAQSASPSELQLLDRLHTYADVIKAYKAATQAGFNLINIDLIYGLPKQTEQSWEETLTRVVTLSPQHLSLYSLTLEHGTPMQAQVSSGQLPKPKSDTVANMYEHAASYLDMHNYRQYEISNWAKTHDYMECRHNLQYWRNQPYIGIGAGAHSWYKQHRYSNTKSPYGYIDRLLSIDNKEISHNRPGSTAMIQSKYIDKTTEMNETMMLCMRLILDGVSHNTFYNRFNIVLADQYEAILNHLSMQGLITIGASNVCLTPSGRLLANRVFSEFI